MSNNDSKTFKIGEVVDVAKDATYDLGSATARFAGKRAVIASDLDSDGDYRLSDLDGGYVGYASPEFLTLVSQSEAEFSIGDRVYVALDATFEGGLYQSSAAGTFDVISHVYDDGDYGLESRAAAHGRFLTLAPESHPEPEDIEVSEPEDLPVLTNWQTLELPAGSVIETRQRFKVAADGDWDPESQQVVHLVSRFDPDAWIEDVVREGRLRHGFDSDTILRIINLVREAGDRA